MFRAIGFLIMLWGLSLYFGDSLQAFNRALVETFQAVETAAVVSQKILDQ